MKTYTVRENVKKLYLGIGLGSLALLVLILIVRPAVFRSASLNFAFYGMTAVLAGLHLFRSRTCCLRIEQNELFFYNGLLDVKHIDLDKIVRIEYNPEIRLRIYMQRKDSVIRIPNVFSEEDTAEILKGIRKRRKKIQIDLIERPGKLNETVGKCEREK